MTLIARANLLGDRIADALLTRSTLDMGRLLTLLLLMTHGPKDWYVRVPVTILALTGILTREARASAPFWFVITMFLFAHDIVSWNSVDNHKWLMCWWTLAVAVTALAPASSRLSALKFNARMILGLCFAFATLWKLISHDYMDSSFFEYELLADKRFAPAATWVGGATDGGLEQNRDYKTDLARSYRKSAEPIESVELSSGPYIGALAVAMTWWTILIEGALAVFCLWPGNGLVAQIRTSITLVFAASTYLLAPVMGFGWLVIIMGFVQCPEQHKKLQASFLPMLALIYLYRTKLVRMALETAETGFTDMVRFF